MAFAVAGVLGSTETFAQTAYITNNQPNNVSVIDTRTNEVTAAERVAGSCPLADRVSGREGE